MTGTPYPGNKVPPELSINGACKKEGMPVDFFFYQSEEIGKQNAKFCKESRCPLIDLCLEFALATHQRGIWGGTTEEQRSEIRRTRRRKAS
jgi:hypothetical protein